MIVFQNNETSAPVAPKSASFHKQENIKISNERKKLSGQRIIAMKIFSNVFGMLLYPICEFETLVLHEDK